MEELFATNLPSVSINIYLLMGVFPHNYFYMILLSPAHAETLGTASNLHFLFLELRNYEPFHPLGRPHQYRRAENFIVV